MLGLYRRTVRGFCFPRSAAPVPLDVVCYKRPDRPGNRGRSRGACEPSGPPFGAPSLYLGTGSVRGAFPFFGKWDHCKIQRGSLPIKKRPDEAVLAEIGHSLSDIRPLGLEAHDILAQTPPREPRRGAARRGYGLGSVEGSSRIPQGNTTRIHSECPINRVHGLTNFTAQSTWLFRKVRTGKRWPIYPLRQGAACALAGALGRRIFRNAAGRCWLRSSPQTIVGTVVQSAQYCPTT